MIGRVLLLAGYLMFMFISWNVRGINDRDKRALPKNFLRDWNCDLICLQETKLEEVEFSDIRSIWGNQAVGFAVLKAIRHLEEF